ncbi:putative short-chain dehydrogenase/reductase family 42E member 2 [Crotalus adamanteus]|uniref:Short-chain dehydrogenase/reductase family 42E member 2 n=1 Tax=Crotalus adamanteus TaxID=8729 RepID=A0AAW1ATS5_CROAD
MEKPNDPKPSRFYKCGKEDAKIVENTAEILTLPLRKVSDKVVITGGAGYFGFTLGCALAKSGTESDVRNFSDLYSACEGVDCLIHTAAYGVTGIEQVHKKRIRSINIGGTGIVLEVCKRQRIPRLIYTSTVDVIFGGQMILDGDEATVSYFPLEQLNIERGFCNVCFGNPGILMNWVHVKNLVQGHILAAKALTPEMNYIAGGQAYFINDGEKVNLFEWLLPLVHNMCVTHTFKIDKARAHLGYAPKKYPFADCVDHFLKKGPQPRSFFLRKCLFLLVLLVGLIVLYVKFTQVRTFLLDSWEKYRCVLKSIATVGGGEKWGWVGGLAFARSPALQRACLPAWGRARRWRAPLPGEKGEKRHAPRSPLLAAAAPPLAPRGFATGFLPLTPVPSGPH